MTAPDVRKAWQAALATEHQAAFGYPLLGPQLAGTDRDLARRCQDEHEALRNLTAERVVSAGLTPVAPLGDYPTLYPVVGAAAARTLAARLEDECAGAWRYLYAVLAAGPSDGPSMALRAQAQAALTASAVRSVRWSGASTAFPGID